MTNNILGAAAAFLLGALLCFGGYKLSEFLIKKKPGKFSVLSSVRTIFSVAYLAAIFFVAPYTPCDRTYLLIGGALGTTIPMFIFTYLLLKKQTGNTTQNNGGEEKNG